jgi:hypothetical protein
MLVAANHFQFSIKKAEKLFFSAFYASVITSVSFGIGNQYFIQNRKPNLIVGCEMNEKE